VPEGERQLLCAQTGEETEWMGIRRWDRRLVQHNACCFGINHWRYVNSHQLYMIDAASEEDPSEELLPDEEAVSTSEESMQNEVAQVVSSRRRPRYFDKRQQLELVLAAQELSELRDPELSPTDSLEEGNQGVRSSSIDIWEDTDCLTLLQQGTLPDAVGVEEGKMIRKRASHYCWKEQKLCFKNLLVPRPEERTSLVRQMHEDLGHFGEQRTLAEI